MEQEKDKELRKTSGRRTSDDVHSLDSWSEVTSDLRDSRNNYDDNKFEKEKVNNELLLSPNRLSTIEEPPEPRSMRVKLYKSDPSQSHGHGHRQHKFFRIPHSYDMTGSSHSKHKSHKLNKKHKQRSVEVSEENTDELIINTEHNPKDSYAFRDHRIQLQNDQLCGCESCMETMTPNGGFADRKIKSSHSYLKQPTHTYEKMRLKQKAKSASGDELDGNDIEQSEKVKNKIISVWNNMKYGWTLKTKTNFEKDSPIFLLGSCYHKRPEDDDPEPGVHTSIPHSMELFKQDFQSRLWFTYRRDFPTLPQTKFTTDCGWGCMLRSSQMMLAQAFITHFLGRDWRAHIQVKEQETYYRHIIQWFGDSPSDQCPFSVHRLAELGKLYGKQPGEWYGPSSVAYIVRDALNKASFSQPVLKDICVYVAQDCTVYKQDVIQLCTTRPRNLTSSNESESSCGTQNGETSTSSDPEEEFKRSVIILIPVRLGGEEYNPIYSSCVKNLMAQECCLGMIGGKPKHSLYFIGWQEDKLIYLDPHFCQDYVDTLKRDFKVESYHCFSPGKMSLRKMDPSATVGFYCRTREDFNKFVDHIEQMVTPKKGSGLYPMFVLHNGKGSDLDITDLSLSVERSVKVRHVTVDQNGKVRSSTVDSEEFVVL